MSQQTNATTSNPFQTSLDLVRAQVYQSQQNLGGFKIRAIVLLALNGGVIILSLAYLAVLEVQRRRATPPQKQWLYQFVRRPPGDLLIMNTRVITATLAIISSTCWIFIILDAFNRYIEHRNPSSGGLVVRAFVTCPIFLHGWVASWSMYTTYILTTKNKPNRPAPLSSVSSGTVNFFFVGFGLSTFLGCIAIGVWQLESVLKFWSRFRSLTNLLGQLAGSYPTAGISTTDSARAAAAAAAFSSASDNFLRVIKLYFILLFIPTSLVSIVNLTGLGLARHLGAHIELSKKGLMRSLEQESVGTGTVAVTERAETAVSDHHDSISVFSPTQTKSHSSPPPRPHSIFILPKNLILNARGLRLIAKSSSLHRKRAEMLVLVSKARSELILLSSFISATAMALTGMLIYSDYACATDQMVHGSWIATELTTMGAAWICGISSCCATLGLFHNMWHYRTSPRGTPGWSSSSSGGAENAASSQIETVPQGMSLDTMTAHPNLRQLGLEQPFQTFDDKEQEELNEQQGRAVPSPRAEPRGASLYSDWVPLSDVGGVRDGAKVVETGREISRGNYSYEGWSFGTATSRR